MQNVLVTGAGRGIGLALCRALKNRGFHVIASVRTATAALEALDVEIVAGVDVCEPQAHRHLLSVMGPRSLALVIHNAGIMQGMGLDSLDTHAIHQQFEVNAVAPLLLTAALRPHLGSGSKVALISSRMGSMTDNSSGASYGYRMSKAALNAAGKSLAYDLAPDGIAVALLHPGWVSTAMTGFGGQISPDESAAMLLARIDGLTLANTGTFWHANGEVLDW